jgi:mRNA-degrading endonuclease RelE of RelBE toxin-antitoxin system
MEPRRIEFTNHFVSVLKRLDPNFREEVKEAIQHFVSRSNENALRVERKEPPSLNAWAFRVNKGNRVFFTTRENPQGKVFILFHVGMHDDYRAMRRKLPK